jgi:hypothetical protein
VTPEDNAAIGEEGVDAEWFAVRKEQKLADKCQVDSGGTSTGTGIGAIPDIWTLMSQNGNAPSPLGSPTECLPYCYNDPDGGLSRGGYPPVVNSSFYSRCGGGGSGGDGGSGGSGGSSGPSVRRGMLTNGLFNSKPMNQAKVLTAFTDGTSAHLRGGFNWTFELQADLSVQEVDFPMNYSLGVWSWETTAEGKGVVRVYQRVSAAYVAMVFISASSAFRCLRLTRLRLISAS